MNLQRNINYIREVFNVNNIVFSVFFLFSIQFSFFSFDVCVKCMNNNNLNHQKKNIYKNVVTKDKQIRTFFLNDNK